MMATPYRALSGNQIRLLTVVPGAHKRDLRFRFTYADADQAAKQTTPYTAVSYTWDHDIDSEVIYVNERPLKVKKNLWACLRCLRQCWQHIWADAICINQGNVAERNQQVAIMGKIYANAAVVSVWLGLVPLPEWITVEGHIVTLEVDDFDWEDNMIDITNRLYWTRS